MALELSSGDSFFQNGFIKTGTRRDDSTKIGIEFQIIVSLIRIHPYAVKVFNRPAAYFLHYL
jgi:hypothetical protein